MKKYTIYIFLLIIFAASFMGCSTIPGDRVTQTSTIDALLAGIYDGSMTCGELLEYGDFGLGTFIGLDGEMIVLDGTVYQARTDGKIYTPGNINSLKNIDLSRDRSAELDKVEK